MRRTGATLGRIARCTSTAPEARAVASRNASSSRRDIEASARTLFEQRSPETSIITRGWRRELIEAAIVCHANCGLSSRRRSLDRRPMRQ